MTFILLAMLFGLIFFYIPTLKYNSGEKVDFIMEVIILGLCILMIMFYVYHLQSFLYKINKAQADVNVAQSQFAKQVNLTIQDLNSRLLKIEKEDKES